MSSEPNYPLKDCEKIRKIKEQKPTIENLLLNEQPSKRIEKLQEYFPNSHRVTGYYSPDSYEPERPITFIETSSNIYIAQISQEENSVQLIIEPHFKNSLQSTLIARKHYL